VKPPTAHHTPVLRERVLGLLAPALTEPGAVLIDATVGLGGHAQAALELFPQIEYVGIDRDPQALALSQARLAQWGNRIRLVHAVYDEIPEVLGYLGIVHANGVLFDLGVSSMQLDDRGRGFSYSAESPLDMRMNPGDEFTAADVVNDYSEAELIRILRAFGEEKFAPRIARGIVRARETHRLSSSTELVSIVRDAVPAAARRRGGNPAKRTFQALRIEVNAELAVLRRAIPAALDVLAVGGRMVVMSYQSLEDRIVKTEFAKRSAADVPIDLPVIPEGSKPSFRLVTRGAELASEDEISDNSRAASVRLRAIERIAA
jgi:16S rRNA (cytosine1402-N4)-methyltransferase